MKRSAPLATLVLALALGGYGGAGQQPRLAGLQRFPGLMRSKQFRREAWLFAQRAYPLGEIPEAARYRALRQTARSRFAPTVAGASGGVAAMGAASGDMWLSMGPAPITDVVAGYTVSGRVESIAVDPSDPTHWLIGAAQGGVWETRDAGAGWSARTEDQVSLAMGAIAFAPSNPQIIYAGTGESAFASHAYAGGGLLKSTDGGVSWQSLGLSTFSQTAFSSLAVDPSNPDVVLAVTAGGIAGRGAEAPPAPPQRGVFKSTDGGLTWVRRLPATGGDCTDLTDISQCIFGTDLKVDPHHFNRQYAALGNPLPNSANGVYQSQDGGDTWGMVFGPWTDMPAGVGRIALALAPSNPDVLYVSIQDAYNLNGDDGGLLGLWRTDNAWASTPSFTQIDTANFIGPSYCETFGEHQCSYDHVLSVDPTNPDILYAGGIPLLKFDGTTWTDASNLFTGNGIHVDQHALAWAGNRLIVGNDGGVWSTTDGGSTWADHNAGLATILFYNGSLHPTNANVALGGAQDNGTSKWSGDTSWNLVAGGDGAANTFSSTHPDTSWAVSFQDLGIIRTTDGGSSFVGGDSGIDKTNVPFIARFTKCPANEDVFIAGTDNLWKSTNFFSAPSPSWVSNGPEMGVTFNFFFRPIGITALNFAASDTSCNTYAFAANAGQLRLTTDGGTSWVDLDPSGGVPGRYVSDLAFDPTDANTLYVALSGFDEGTPTAPGHLFKTTNALAPTPTWFNVSPPVDIPHNAIAVDPSSPSRLYVGTDIGVWVSPDAGGTWTHMGPESGMPNVAVFDLQANAATGRVVAFTLGRSAFVLSHPGGNHAYITNSGEDTVSVIDATVVPPAVVATVPVGHGPAGVAVQPSGALVYVANAADGAVSIIDTGNNQVTGAITVGSQPQGLAVNPAGTRLYAANFADNTVSVIDTMARTVVATIPVGGGPYGVAVNAPGSRAYVTNQSDNTLSVIDTALNTVTASIPVGVQPTGVAVNPAGMRVYVASSGDDEVYVIDTATNAVIGSTVSLPTPTGLAINPWGTRLYVTSGRGSSEYCVEDLATDPPTHLFCQGTVAGPVGATVNAAGTQLYIANADDNTVGVFDLTIESPANPNIASIPVGTAPLAFGQFIQSTAGAGVQAASGSCSLQLVAGSALTGSITFDAGSFNVFGAPVDLSSAPGSMALTGQVHDFNGSGGALSAHLQALPLGFDVAGSFGSVGGSFSLAARLNNITGSVLPGGLVYMLEGAFTASGLNNYSGTCQLNAFVAGNTPTGSNVTTSVRSTLGLCGQPVVDIPVSVTYGTVLSGGSTLITPACSAPGDVAAQFRTGLGGYQFYFDVSSTATVTAPITVCFQYPDSMTAEIGRTLRLLHDESGTFTDRTVLPVDTAHRKLCAQVSSLSPFVVAQHVTDALGFVPPDPPSLRCESGLNRHAAALARTVNACHLKAVRAALQLQTFDEEGCERTAKIKYDAANARLSGCPSCVLGNEAAVATLVEARFDDLSGGMYCAAGTALGGDDAFTSVPADKATLSCENRLAQHAIVLARALLACHRKQAAFAFASKSFDEQACKTAARARYTAANRTLSGCAACLTTNAPAIANQIEVLSDGMNGQIDCAGTTPLAE